MPMKDPPHPGHSIKDACLDALNLSVTDAAKVLGCGAVFPRRAGAARLEVAGLSSVKQTSPATRLIRQLVDDAAGV